MAARAVGATLIVLILALLGGPLRAAAGAEDLARLLRVEQLAQALHDEGVQHGQTLDQELLDGQGGDHWAAEVLRIYDTARIEQAIRRALADHMGPEEIAETMAFYGTDLGQRILTLEISARVAMHDPDVEAAARAAYDQLRDAGDDKVLDPIRRYVAVNDLIERNVASAMNASYQFLSGMAAGGAFKMGDAGVMAQVWGEEEATRAETESWLYAYLLMAYRPLTAPEMDRYITYADSRAGRALNAALFQGFDDLYQGISYLLGRRLAAAMQSSKI